MSKNIDFGLKMNNAKKLQKVILRVGDYVTLFALGVVTVCFLIGSFIPGLVVLALCLLLSNSGHLIKIQTILEDELKKNKK